MTEWLSYCQLRKFLCQEEIGRRCVSLFGGTHLRHHMVWLATLAWSGFGARSMAEYLASGEKIDVGKCIKLTRLARFASNVVRNRLPIELRRRIYICVLGGNVLHTCFLGRPERRTAPRMMWGYAVERIFALRFRSSLGSDDVFKKNVLDLPRARI